MRRYFFCGNTWSDASTRCYKRCLSGYHTECPGDQECFAQAACKKLLTPKPSAAPSPVSNFTWSELNISFYPLNAFKIQIRPHLQAHGLQLQVLGLPMCQQIPSLQNLQVRYFLRLYFTFTARKIDRFLFDFQFLTRPRALRMTRQTSQRHLIQQIE